MCLVMSVSLFAFLGLNSSAATSVLILACDKMSANGGDKVTLTLSVPGGISGIECKLNFDTNYVSNLSVKNLTGDMIVSGSDGNVAKNNTYGRVKCVYAGKAISARDAFTAEFTVKKPFSDYRTVFSAEVTEATDSEERVCFVSNHRIICFPDINIKLKTTAEEFEKSKPWYYNAVEYVAVRLYINGYQNGNFGPSDNLQRQDFVVILANIVGADLSGYKTCKLTDVDMGAYYGKAVAWAVDNGIISGYQNGKFGVGDPITREQVATILYKYKNSPEVDNVEKTLASFTSDGDKISDFARTPIAWAVQNGVMKGKNTTTMAPGNTAARAEIATMVMNMDKNGMFK